MSRSPIYLARILPGLMLAGLLLFVFTAKGEEKLPATLQNPDFEKGEVGEAPAGWGDPREENPYTVEITSESPRKGKKCAVLYTKAGAHPGSDDFGNMVQHIDAKKYRGRIIRFRAAMRVEGDSARAQLWARVDRSDREGYFFSTMEPVRAGDWQYYQIGGEVDKNAQTLNIGMFMAGSGKAWIDDASLEILDLPPFPREPVRKLSQRGMENILAFARLYGYVRFFHPSDQAAATDWNAFVIGGVREVEGARDAEELVKRLRGLFAPIAPLVGIVTTGAPPPVPPEPATLEGLELIRWRHVGVGLSPSSVFDDRMYRSERERAPLHNGMVPPGWPNPGESLYYELDGGVACAVPVSLFMDARGTIPHLALPPAADPNDLLRYTGDDRATRLAGVIMAWNVLQHFYPYFDVVEVDWPAALRDALTMAAVDAGRVEFTQTLERMVAKLRDGHGIVWHWTRQRRYSVPLRWEWIEGKLVVTQVAPGAGVNVARGEIVLSIDRAPVAERIMEEEIYVSAATDSERRGKAVTRLLFGAENSSITVQVADSLGTPRTVRLRRTHYGEVAEERPYGIEQIQPRIMYLDLEKINDRTFRLLLPELRQMHTIIFDARGYPAVSPDVLTYFIDDTVQSGIGNIPIVTIPDHNFDAYDTSGLWTLEPKKERLTARTIYLTDSKAISYAEAYLGIVEAYQLGPIIGEPTAGTDGDVNRIALPGDYQIQWTGMRVLKPDGSQHHGIGILPTVPVRRTIQGIRAGRDEQLEKALEMAKGVIDDKSEEMMNDGSK